MMSLLLSSLWFQLLWLAAVLGREHWQWPLLSTICLTCLISLWRGDIPLSFIAGVLFTGLFIDSINQQLSLLEFTTSYLPLWLAGLWLIFAWYCWQLRFLLIRLPLLLVSMAGAAGGALSYFAGYKLGAVEWPKDHTDTFFILFSEWFLLSLAVGYLLRNKWSSL
jgi:hypothetical protein